MALAAVACLDTLRGWPDCGECGSGIRYLSLPRIAGLAGFQAAVPASFPRVEAIAARGAHCLGHSDFE